MCTLTYLLNEHGYELFFNRDEQRSRLLAEPPQFNVINNAVYPIDPQGGGTWIAVNKQGMSLALLNNYQAPFNHHPNIMSRGQLILSLLQGKASIVEQLEVMDLRVYQPFQLCIFPEGLSSHHQDIFCVKWNGSQLDSVDGELPITSSGIDFMEVSQKRKLRFLHFVDSHKPLSNQFKDFHSSTEANGKHSVNMQRDDAKTVSISHISVSNEIRFEYFDNVSKESHAITV